MTSTDIRDGGALLTDIATSAKKSLHGQQGHAAAIGSASQFLRGNASDGGHASNGSGSYTIGFPTNVSNCTYTATLGSTDSESTPDTSPSAKTAALGIQICDTAGNPVDRAFTFSSPAETGDAVEGVCGHPRSAYVGGSTFKQVGPPVAFDDVHGRRAPHFAALLSRP